MNNKKYTETFVLGHPVCIDKFRKIIIFCSSSAELQPVHIPVAAKAKESGEEESSDKEFKEEATKAVKVEEVNKLLVFGGGAGVLWWIGKVYSTYNL